VVLGLNGYGRSDGRAALRQFFEVDLTMCGRGAQALSDTASSIAPPSPRRMKDFGIDPAKPNP